MKGGWEKVESGRDLGREGTHTVTLDLLQVSFYK